jgi:dolichyl-phosphate beta-glucosyltransferase
MVPDQRCRRTVIIPMHREASRIARCVEELAACALSDPDVQLIFVDDGSDDATVAVLHEALRRSPLRAEVVLLGRNCGKGEAVRQGVLRARGDAVCFTDVDLSAPTDEIVRCLDEIDLGADVVVASRGHDASLITTHQPQPRERAGKAFNLAVRTLGLLDLPDTQCGLKAFRRDIALELFCDLQTRRFAFDVEVLLRARLLSCDVRVVPVEWGHVGDSRVAPLRDGYQMLRDVARLRWRLRSFPTHPRTIVLPEARTGQHDRLERPRPRAALAAPSVDA